MDTLFPFFAGILAFLSPCIIPMVTVYLSLITGLTVDKLLDDTTAVVRRQVVANTAYFVAGFAVIYIAAGAAAGYVGNFLSANQDTLNLVGGSIIILFGVQTMGLLKSLPLNPLVLLNRVKVARSDGAVSAVPTRVRSFGVGLLFAVACSHCFGGLLTSVLVSAGVRGSQTGGALSLAMFSLGLAVPFMILAWTVSPVIEKLKRVQGRLRLVNMLGGAFLIFFGMLTATGRFSLLAEFFSGLSPL